MIELKLLFLVYCDKCHISAVNGLNYISQNRVILCLLYIYPEISPNPGEDNLTAQYYY